jgi:hypothetical protein
VAEKQTLALECILSTTLFCCNDWVCGRVYTIYHTRAS